VKLPLLLKFLSYWPPYLGAGVKIKKISPDFCSIDVEMKLRFWNKGHFGTHFGGSLYSMTDPFIALILIHHLGPEYTIWDKAASIKFKRPGRGHVRAHFSVTHEQIKSIRDTADSHAKAEPVFKVHIVDREGITIAEVEKVIYVSRKDKTRKRESRS
jgi:acyl-coenzyme A thioesterase PaaI-like protein